MACQEGFVLRFAFFLLCLVGSLFSLPSSNPSHPGRIQKGIFSSPKGWFAWRVGYEGDFVLDAKMETLQEKKIDSWKKFSQLCLLTLGLVNRLDCCALLGNSFIDADWRFVDTSNETFRIAMQTKEDWQWALGAKAILFQWFNASLGIGGRYGYFEAPLKTLKSNGTSLSKLEAKVECEEWQVGIDFSYKVRFFIPYIGAFYRDAKAHLRNFSTPLSPSSSGDLEVRGREPYGLDLGCSISNGKYFLLNVEARLFSEEAMSVSFESRF